MSRIGEGMSVERPIEVNSTALPAMVITAIRYLVQLLAGYLITKGMLPEGTDINVLIGIVIGVVTLIWGVVATKRSNAKQKVMAAVLPDSIARIK